MPRTALVIGFALALPTFGLLHHSASPSGQGKANTAVESRIVCSDSAPLLPAQRTPEACAQSDYAQYGRPLMFALHDGVAYGVSVAQDKPGTVTIWMDNQTEKPQTVYFCCNATFVRYIDLYDHTGQRVPSRIEIDNEKSPLADKHDPRIVAGCGCSGWSTVPPHSLKVVDHGDLDVNYSLTPGRYTIVEYPPRQTNAVAFIPSPTLPPSGPRLVISLP